MNGTKLIFADNCSLKCFPLALLSHVSRAQRRVVFQQTHYPVQAMFIPMGERKLQLQKKVYNWPSVSHRMASTCTNLFRHMQVLNDKSNYRRNCTHKYACSNALAFKCECCGHCDVRFLLNLLLIFFSIPLSLF